MSLASYLRDADHRSAVVLAGAEDTLRYTEAARSLDTFFAEWARNGDSGNPLVLVFAQPTLEGCVSYVERLDGYPALAARLRRQAATPGRQSAARVGCPDEAELHRLIQRLRLRDELAIGAWPQLDALVRAMAAEQLTVKNWRSRLRALAPVPLTREALTARDGLRAAGGGADARPAHERLAELPGLEPVKEHLERLRRRMAAERRLSAQGRGVGAEPASPHLLFSGPPGTGKTTVARLVGEMYRELGLLRRGHVVETRLDDLVAGYVGQTAGRTNAVVDRALDGVLFIDEAYGLSDQQDGFGGEAIQALLTRMENDRDRLVVVVAGYADKMTEFLAANPGLARRFGERIAFPDYPPDVLHTIVLRALAERGLRWDEPLTGLLLRAVTGIHAVRSDDFGNAGAMRDLAQQIFTGWAARVGEDIDQPLTVADLPASCREHLDRPPPDAAAVLAELDGMVGLGAVREVLTDLADRIRLRQARGRAAPAPPHLLFTGPPGTGKTTVARAVGSMFRELGLLRRGHVHEVTRADLVAEFVGQTAPRTREAVRQALDGVLFIDEAYSLSSGSGGGRATHDYGREAIDTLTREMEHFNDRLVVIAAGYPREMDEFVRGNSGLGSRFALRVDFPRYTTPELLEVLRRAAAEEGYTIGEAAAERAGRWLDARWRANPEGFGNAREVRGLLAAMEARLVRRLREAAALAAASGGTGIPDLASADFTADDVPDPGGSP
jgi:SpoVK/Ycf46/Vps4 family AAA+-type ATPase